MPRGGRRRAGAAAPRRTGRPERALPGRRRGRPTALAVRQLPALVAASYEDFGLTPLECADFGRPAVVLRWGGYLETVVEDETGVFFPTPKPDAIRQAVRLLAGQNIREEVLRRHAERFSETAVVRELRRQVADA